mmetsp:Transcript_38863/g.115627  ORF Transcript_38863/g.115627 Transcript_38863/m.115627 type:complete len:213 (+) Transcript_38863:1418-2056(+)
MHGNTRCQPRQRASSASHSRTMSGRSSSRMPRKSTAAASCTVRGPCAPAAVAPPPSGVLFRPVSLACFRAASTAAYLSMSYGTTPSKCNRSPTIAYLTRRSTCESAASDGYVLTSMSHALNAASSMMSNPHTSKQLLRCGTLSLTCGLICGSTASMVCATMSCTWLHTCSHGTRPSASMCARSASSDHLVAVLPSASMTSFAFTFASFLLTE